MHLDYRQTLSKYLPANAVDLVCKIIFDFQISLKITSLRKTKLGDYRSPLKGSTHKISINGNLHPDLFLLVFIHEYAHLLIWNEYKNKVNPHGSEWKACYGYLIREFLANNCFKEDVTEELYKFSLKPKASFAGDIKMWKKMKQLYNIGMENYFLDELPFGALFKSSNGRLFRKDSKIRTRIRCRCVKTKRWYLFHPLADIMPLYEAEVPV